MKIRVTNIIYELDEDCKELVLPNEMILDVKNVEYGAIADAVSDKTGFLVKSLHYALELGTAKEFTQNQKEILKKEFKINEHFAISRGDYESLPAPMLAWNWNDEQMEELAKCIGNALPDYDENCSERMNEIFWKEMEKCAIKLGMRYYEDIDEEEFAELEKQWNELSCLTHNGQI